jgi:hypothetical protein
MSNTPEPGDPCQWEEFDAEVLSFDEEHGVVWIFVHSGEPLDIRAIPYRPNDWQ